MVTLTRRIPETCSLKLICPGTWTTLVSTHMLFWHWFLPVISFRERACKLQTINWPNLIHIHFLTNLWHYLDSKPSQKCRSSLIKTYYLYNTAYFFRLFYKSPFSWRIKEKIEDKLWEYISNVIFSILMYFSLKFLIVCIGNYLICNNLQIFVLKTSELKSFSY